MDYVCLLPENSQQDKAHILSGLKYTYIYTCTCICFAFFMNIQVSKSRKQNYIHFQMKIFFLIIPPKTPAANTCIYNQASTM